MCTALKKSPDEVGEMDFRDIQELYEYWREVPPVDEMVAAFLGYKPPAKDAPVKIGAPSIPFSELKAIMQSAAMTPMGG